MDGTPHDGVGAQLGAPFDGMVAFRCDVLHVADQAVVVARGDIDLDTAPVLLDQLRATVALGVTGVTVDMSDVMFLDSSGVHALLSARSAAAERGVVFRLESVPRQARTVLELCGLSGLLGLDAQSDASVPLSGGEDTHRAKRVAGRHCNLRN